MSNSNTSATGGYLLPSPKFPTLPGDLTFKQFIQQAFVGVSGMCAELVRPKWQLNPPKQPDVLTNWIALALVENASDPYIYSGVDSDGNNQTQRMEQLEVQCSFYGPDSDEIAALVRDGFQVSQNMEALRAAKMGFVGTNNMMHVPDLVNERWVDRYEMSFIFRREILRTYPVLNFVSVSGTIQSVLYVDNLKTLAWDSKNGES